MRFGIVVFPGTWSDTDCYHAVAGVLQQDAQYLWHQESTINDVDCLILPGGFSYGDYLRSGCIASKSRIINDIIKHAKNGGLILGICNGFQILIETGLLKGSLLRNKKLRFISKNVFLKVTNIQNHFCKDYKKKNIIKLPIAHNEGNYFASSELLKNLEDNNLIAFKYCNKKGEVNIDSNPNGSSNNIAGIFSKEKNILGMMPHPERLIDPILSGEDGSIMFESLLKSH